MADETPTPTVDETVPPALADVEPAQPVAPDAVDAPGVIGLNGRPAAIPSGGWLAAVGPDGALERDPDGRLIRVREDGTRPDPA